MAAVNSLKAIAMKSDEHMQVLSHLFELNDPVMDDLIESPRGGRVRTALADLANAGWLKWDGGILAYPDNSKITAEVWQELSRELVSPQFVHPKRLRAAIRRRDRSQRPLAFDNDVLRTSGEALNPRPPLLPTEPQEGTLTHTVLSAIRTGPATVEVLAQRSNLSIANVRSCIGSLCYRFAWDIRNLGKVGGPPTPFYLHPQPTAA